MPGSFLNWLRKGVDYDKLSTGTQSRVRSYGRTETPKIPSCDDLSGLTAHLHLYTHGEYWQDGMLGGCLACVLIIADTLLRCSFSQSISQKTG
jgi:hypothetical protein